MTHFGSSDHESMTGPLKANIRRRGDQMEINASDGLTARAPATLGGRQSGRPYYENGRTPPADLESVKHCDTMRNTAAALLSMAWCA